MRQGGTNATNRVVVAGGGGGGGFAGSVNGSGGAGGGLIGGNGYYNNRNTIELSDTSYGAGGGFTFPGKTILRLGTNGVGGTATSSGGGGGGAGGDTPATGVLMVGPVDASTAGSRVIGTAGVVAPLTAEAIQALSPTAASAHNSSGSGVTPMSRGSSGSSVYSAVSHPLVGGPGAAEAPGETLCLFAGMS